MTLYSVVLPRILDYPQSALRDVGKRRSSWYFIQILCFVFCSLILQPRYCNKQGCAWCKYGSVRCGAPSVIVGYGVCNVYTRILVPQILVYGGVGPSLDFVFDDYPGTGAVCLCGSQLVFALRVIRTQRATSAVWSIGVGTGVLCAAYTGHIVSTWRYYKYWSDTMHTVRNQHPSRVQRTFFWRTHLPHWRRQASDSSANTLGVFEEAM
jgi:hypothetical protein